MPKMKQPAGHRARVKSRIPRHAKLVPVGAFSLNRIARAKGWPVRVVTEAEAYAPHLVKLDGEIEAAEAEGDHERARRLQANRAKVEATLAGIDPNSTKLLFMSTDPDGRNRKERRAAAKWDAKLRSAVARADHESRSTQALKVLEGAAEAPELDDGP